MAIALKKFQKCFADFVAGQCSRPFSEDLGTEFREHYRIIFKRDSQYHGHRAIDLSVPGIVMGFPNRGTAPCPERSLGMPRPYNRGGRPDAMRRPQFVLGQGAR